MRAPAAAAEITAAQAGASPLACKYHTNARKHDMKKIKPLQCGQCGSHDIRREKDGFVCNYCGTVHYGGGAGDLVSAALALARRHRAVTAVAASLLLFVTALVIVFFTGRNTPHQDEPAGIGSENGGGAIEKGGDSIEPEKKAGAEFTDIAALPDGIGNIYFVGMFTNTGETPVYPRAEIALYAAGGMKVAVARGYGIRNYILPGEKTPVQVLVTAAPSYVAVRSIGVPEIPGYFQERPKMAISGLNMKRPESRIDRYRVNGIVKNISGKNARYVQIGVAVFDGSGNIIGYGTNFLGQTLLAAGEESPFMVEIHLMKGEPARYMVEYDALPDKSTN